MHTAIYESPIGLITIESDEDALTGLWIEGQRHTSKNAANTQYAQNGHSPTDLKKAQRKMKERIVLEKSSNKPANGWTSILQAKSLRSCHQ